MKNNFNFFIGVMGALLFLASCEKVDPLPYYNTGKESALTLSTTTVTLSHENAEQEVITFSWTNPEFATSEAQYKYVVELAPKGADFTNAVAFVVVGKHNSLSVKGSDLNNALVAWGKSFGEVVDLEARLKTSYANNNDMKISPAVDLKVTPYAIPFSLSATATGTFSPTPQTKDDIFTTLSWTVPSYGNATLHYELEYAKAGTNFSNPGIIVIAADSLSKSLTGFEIFQMANTVDIPLNTTDDIEVRVKAIINKTGQTSYSSVQTLRVTPVEMTLYMYVPGDYQGWNPETASRIASSDGIHYEGYIWIPAGGNGEFKITTEPNWSSLNYGGTSTATGGTLVSNGDNLRFPETGAYYLLKANVHTMEWTITKTEWGLIGNATPGGWDNSTPMVYDPIVGKWKVTVTFTEGYFKFRANNGWDINLGNGGAYLSYGGGDIPVSAATKTVWLDLSSPLKYTYTIE